MKKTIALTLLLLGGCAAVQITPPGIYQARLAIEEAGLANAKVVDAEGKTLRILFQNKAVEKGILELAWDGQGDKVEAETGQIYRVVVEVSRWGIDRLDEFGGLGASPGRFVNPAGLSAARQGAHLTLAVADKGNNRIQLLTETGSFLQEIGQFGLGDQRLNQPTDVDWDGQILTVCDSQNRRLARFDAAGAYLGQVAQLSGLPASPSNPIHLDFQNPVNLQREGGGFWVSDEGYGILDLTTSTGGLIQQLGQNIPLNNEGPFLKWPGGDIWIKTGKSDVRRLDPHGNDLGPLQVEPVFQAVGGFTWSPQGFALISDMAQGLIYLLDAEGKCFGTLLTDDCPEPAGLALFEDHLFVVEQDQSKIFHYQLVPLRSHEYEMNLVVQPSSPRAKP